MVVLFLCAVPQDKEDKDVVVLGIVQERSHVADQGTLGVRLVHVTVAREMGRRFALDVQPDALNIVQDFKGRLPSTL